MKLYLDMDGVLADFDSAQSAALAELRSRGASAPELRDEKFRMMIRPGFFAGLPLMPGAHQLVSRATEIFGGRPGILSSPMSLRGRPTVRQQCVEEKTRWLNEHFRGAFDDIIFEREKHIHARPGVVLVDDREGNVDAFTAAGGVGVLHKGDVQATLARLHDISQTTDATLREAIRGLLLCGNVL